MLSTPQQGAVLSENITTTTVRKFTYTPFVLSVSKEMGLMSFDTLRTNGGISVYVFPKSCTMLFVAG